MIPLLDTHIWLWWILDSDHLSVKRKDYLNNLSANQRPFLCDISLWEVAMLVKKKRLQLDMELGEFLTLAAHSETVRLISIHPKIASAMNDLPDSFQKDPADRLIVSTSKVLNIPLWTEDRLIIQSKVARVFDPRKAMP